jgi:hypothetical protein
MIWRDIDLIFRSLFVDKMKFKNGPIRDHKRSQKQADMLLPVAALRDHTRSPVFTSSMRNTPRSVFTSVPPTKHSPPSMIRSTAVASSSKRASPMRLLTAPNTLGTITSVATFSACSPYDTRCVGI